MRRFGFMVSAAFACLFAGAAAVSTVASRDWVQKKLAEAGITINTATVTHNTNGTVTATSQFACDEVPSLRSVTFTATQASFVTHPVVSDSRLFLMRLLVPTAYADTVGGENSLTVKVLSGFWTDNLGNEHPFDFGADGLNITLDEDMPEVPSDQHTCDPDGSNNCICRWYGKSDAERSAAVPADYNDWTPAEWAGAVGSMDAWVQDEGFRESVTKKGTTYWITDLNGTEINLSNVAKSDAWTAALADGLTKINQRMKDCRDAYKRSLTCSNGEEQHQWGLTESKTCGANTWTKKVCSRNGAHKQETGTAQHDFSSSRWGSVNDSDHRRYCACKQTYEDASHSKTGGGGSKTYKYNSSGGIVGWTTAPEYCTDNCGWYKAGINHTCKHVKCATCSAGDGCSLPCPTCNGQHSIESAGGGKCQRCKCEGCKGTEYELKGTRTRSKHTGWHNCGYLQDADNDRSGGVHCECECGDYSHENGTQHERQNRTAVREKILESENAYADSHETYHWVSNKKDCTYCGDKYGNFEAHVFDEEQGSVATYRYKSESKHTKKISCGLRCGYKKDEGELDHVKEGDTVTYENVSESVCREWNRCSTDDGCGCLFPDNSHGHERDPSNECKCSRCKDYQFAHVFTEEDACGNKRCTYCGKLDPSRPEQHIGCSDIGGGRHQCDCGGRSGGHVWGTWTEISRSGSLVTYQAHCVSCQWQPQGCGATRTKTCEELEGCDEDEGIHIANTDACGCVCGHYGPGGEVSADEGFHHWDGSDCWCNCAAWHHAASGNECPLVCAKCKEYAATDGLNPVKITESNAEQYHVPNDPTVTHVYRCGCRCQSYGPELSGEAFHPQKPGTCRCYGADGNGGNWHFHEPDPNCPGTCKYRNSFCHKVSAQKENLKCLIPATVDDHAKATLTVCACKCGEWGEGGGKEIPKDSHLHQWESGTCVCHCGDNDSNPSNDPDDHGYSGGYCVCDCKRAHKHVSGCECSGVCDGTCNGYYKAEDGIIAELQATQPNDHTRVGGEECGCLCGKYSMTSKPPEDCDLHNFKSGECKCFCKVKCNPDANEHKYDPGHCVCECGRMHRGIAGNACPAICKNCKRAVDDTNGSTETDVTGIESYHTAKANGCGCKCGKFTPSNISASSALHVQNMGYCGCYCRAQTGSHRHASSSTSSCNPCYCGDESHKQHHQDPESCGCHCGTYSAGQGGMVHKWVGSSCWCSCGSQHNPQPGVCSRICTKCGYLTDNTKNYPTFTDHTPKGNGCGCKCGAYGGGSYEASRYPSYHGGHGSPSCLCQCGQLHLNFSASSCPNVCSVCGMNRARTNSGIDIHTFNESCKCNCRKFTDHRYGSGSCYCYCGTNFRGHDWILASDSKVGEHTCGTCGYTIDEMHRVERCRRCGEENEYDYERGHAWDCGQDPGPGPDHETHCDGCGCTDCSCEACQAGSGKCSRCGGNCSTGGGTSGGGGGGESGGSDPLEDI